MKRCKWCNQEKPITEFYKQKGMKDGHLNKCRSCVYETVYHWRIKNPSYRAKEYRRIKGKDPTTYRAKAAARSAKRRVAITAAKASWANKDYIQDLYTNSSEANKVFERVGLTPDYQVDHIIPIKNKKVCGLHTEHNLQILTAKENLIKSNKFSGY